MAMIYKLIISIMSLTFRAIGVELIKTAKLQNISNEHNRHKGHHDFMIKP